VIGSQEIARAEQVLKIVYGSDMGRTLRAFEVEREAFDNMIEHLNAVIDNHYRQPVRAMDPRLHGAFNTAMGHCFLVGMIAGGHRAREIS